jgi:pantetheine-phosphate adenylyltransferase
MTWISQTFQQNNKIEIKQFSGLTVHFCKKVGAEYLIRGLRNSSDFDYEKTISQLNADLGGIETVFMISKPEYSHISSTIVREIIMGKGDASRFLPESIKMT